MTRFGFERRPEPPDHYERCSRIVEQGFLRLFRPRFRDYVPPEHESALLIYNAFKGAREVRKRWGNQHEFRIVGGEISTKVKQLGEDEFLRHFRDALEYHGIPPDVFRISLYNNGGGIHITLDHAVDRLLDEHRNALALREALVRAMRANPKD